MEKPIRKYRCMPALEEVKIDFDAGMTNFAMAEKYGVGLSVVADFLRKHGLRRKAKNAIPSDAEILSCLQEGLSSRQMAERLGCNAGSLLRYIRANSLRSQVSEAPPQQRADPVNLRPGPQKVINALGISIPRIVTIHGPYEARL